MRGTRQRWCSIIIITVFITLLFVGCGNKKNEVPEDEKLVDLSPEYNVKIIVHCVPNLIFSRYDVDLKIDNEKLGVIKHGEDEEFVVALHEGTHTVEFCEHGSYLKNEIPIAITSDIVASYKISCYRDRIEIDTVFVDYIEDENSNLATINFSNIDLSGKNYEEVIFLLKGLGFRNIKEEPLYDVKKWDAKEEKVEAVTIGGKKDYKFGDKFQKDTEIIIRYHMPYQENSIPAEVTATPLPVPATQPPASTSKEVLTIDNNDDLKSLLTADAVDGNKQEEFVKKYKGRVIEFDAIVFYLSPHPKYSTIYSYVIVPGPGKNSEIMGASLFMLENMSMFDFKWDKSTRPVQW